MSYQDQIEFEDAVVLIRRLQQRVVMLEAAVESLVEELQLLKASVLGPVEDKDDPEQTSLGLDVLEGE